MIDIGDHLPEFEVQATDGTKVSSRALLGRLVVVYFFPRAFTPGCTRETKAFRDEYPGLAAAGAEIIGVSTDSHVQQCKFAEWAGVTFPMIGDEHGELGRRFGVLWPIVGVPKRVTFVADPTGVVRHVFRHEIRIDAHVTDVLRAVEALRSERRG
ncbi:peroxiredoxin [soil metagenome]